MPSDGRGGSPAFPPLRYAELHVALRALSARPLPRDKGSALHGLLGWAMAEMLCRIEGGPDCTGCWLRAGCGYGVLYGEPMPIPAPRGLRGVDTPPRPYAISCTDRRERVAAGDTFSFTVRLFGRAAELQGSIAWALEQYEAVTCDRGESQQLAAPDEAALVFGPSRFSLASLSRTTSAGSREELLGRMRRDQPYHVEILLSAPSLPPTDALRISFLAPTGLRSPTSKGWLYALVRAVRTRAEWLAQIYDGWEPGDARFTDLLRLAESVQVLTNREDERVRYASGNLGRSSRPIRGTQLVFDVPQCPVVLRETLAWGQLLHVGHNYTSGLGGYVVQALPTDEAV